MFAAAVAASVALDATVDSVIDAALRVAHDGTAAAIRAVVDAARGLGPDADEEQIGLALRDAIRPFDTVGDAYREPLMDARVPSRTKSIEELPVALGFLVAHEGAFLPTVLGAVNYGRDSDSIASMAGSLAAGIGGQAVIPSDMLDTIATASRVDFDEYAALLSSVAVDVMQKDAARAEADLRRVASLREA